MGLMDRFRRSNSQRKMKQVPAHAKPARRQRRDGSYDEGFMVGSYFYLLDDSVTNDSSYSGPAEVVTDFSDVEYSESVPANESAAPESHSSGTSYDDNSRGGYTTSPSNYDAPYYGYDSGRSSSSYDSGSSGYSSGGSSSSSSDSGSSGYSSGGSSSSSYDSGSSGYSSDSGSY